MSVISFVAVNTLEAFTLSVFFFPSECVQSGHTTAVQERVAEKWLLLQEITEVRCVAVRKLPTCITTRRSSSVLSAGSGFTLQPTWTSTTRAVCPLQLAVRTSQYRFCTKPEPEPEKQEVYFIEVRGLPWSCSCRILDGEKGIHLTVDRNGRLSGEAFIQVEHEDDVRKALEKHRQYLGPRYVEGLEIVGSGITFIQNRRGKNSGEAFVQFSSKEAADEALQKDREHIGQRYIEVFPSSTDQIYSSWVGKSSSVPPQTGTQSTNRKKASDSWDKQGSPQGHHIHMRGLPYQVSADDIVKFFSPLVVSKITIACSPEGRPKGEAEVYFSTHQDALSAMSRDRDYIVSSPSEEQQAVRTQRRHGDARSAAPALSSAPPPDNP
ncbi:hypothetical protein F7725_013214 [Dissostichus mawsoni]|uniref:RRM domain-containing protein n=1 Tax=Dissostichus mawsoni TaxID=36200 RepID=A0A7J5YPG5_DISMA|nr:hypothetical protein F7725_013214 [Dissostichus mawsoni]